MLIDKYSYASFNGKDFLIHRVTNAHYYDKEGKEGIAYPIDECKLLNVAKKGTLMRCGPSTFIVDNVTIIRDKLYYIGINGNVYYYNMCKPVQIDWPQPDKPVQIDPPSSIKRPPFKPGQYGRIVYNMETPVIPCDVSNSEPLAHIGIAAQPYGMTIDALEEASHFLSQLAEQMKEERKTPLQQANDMHKSLDELIVRIQTLKPAQQAIELEKWKKQL